MVYSFVGGKESYLFTGTIEVADGKHSCCD
jgi:hypothetical protein